MNIIENWNFLNNRMKESAPDVTPHLFEIHMGSFDDLRRSGHRMSINNQTVGQLAPTLDPFERLDLAGAIGQHLINLNMDSVSLNHKEYLIDQADYFPNCIFIAIAAILENLDGCFGEDRKMTVVCEYETADGNEDPLGKKLPLLQDCFPWIDLTIKTKEAKQEEPSEPRYIESSETSVLFGVMELAKLGIQRTVFIGDVLRGSIKEGDCLNVVDKTGRVLCPEGVVLNMWVDGTKVEIANEGQHVDELLVAVEIPEGTYDGMFLVEMIPPSRTP